MQPISLLLVDDRDDGLHILEHALSRSFQTVDMASGIEEALTQYDQKEYDIVIVALEMYNNEGYETINAIHDKKPDQRIITYSADPEKPSSHVSCETCMKQNRRHRIRKPVILTELIHEIENFDGLCCHEGSLRTHKS